MLNSSHPSVALVLPGEAMWGAFQTGAVFELGETLQKAGFGDHPFDVAIGSSSGSLIAAAAAAGGRYDHDLACDTWVNFGRATRLLQTSLSLNPYPKAFQNIMTCGLVDLDRAFSSQTRLVVTATHYQKDALSDLWNDHLQMFWVALQQFVGAPSDADEPLLNGIGATLLTDGNRLFSTRYFSTHAKPDSLHLSTAMDEQWSVIPNPEALRTAVEASSRVPFLYGKSIVDGAHILIDGVFANNAPVQLALEYGAAHVVIITSSKKGYVFDRPIQSLFRSRLRSVLKNLDKAATHLSRIPKLDMSTVLSRLAHLSEHIPPTTPVDLDRLRRLYPNQKIHVIHPTEKIPVNRFFESRKHILKGIYQKGRMAARQMRIV